MNLLTDAWIPVVRRSGRRQTIIPTAITDSYDADPVVDIGAPRPDFNGALVQFLIGMLQTGCAPSTPRDWRRWFDSPPTPRALASSLADLAPAFEFDAESGPRFMQDLTLDEAEAQILAVDRILIDSPGDNTLKKNADVFIKRGRLDALCPSCAAAALFTLQTNAPSGGQGYRTGIRGGGPLTTLLAADTLWHTVWLNVLEREVFLSLGSRERTSPADRFPWMAPTRTSEQGTGTSTTPEDAHADQIYWSMPRRIRLRFENAINSCGVCGSMAGPGVRVFATRNLGVNYEGAWVHPLSAYSTNRDGERYAFHTPAGGVGYRHWLGLVQEHSDVGRSPARVVATFKEEPDRRSRSGYRLWAFGFEMDNMKACCWYEGEMPIVLAESAVQSQFEALIHDLILAAEYGAELSVFAVKAAMSRRPTDLRGDMSWAQRQFWQATEPEFLSTILAARAVVEAGADTAPVRTAWHAVLCRRASEVFESHSQSGLFDAVDPGRIADAWKRLQMNLRGPRMRAFLGLPDSKPSEGSHGRRQPKKGDTR